VLAFFLTADGKVNPLPVCFALASAALVVLSPFLTLNILVVGLPFKVSPLPNFS
jgi:hypothetical protein